MVSEPRVSGWCAGNWLRRVPHQQSYSARQILLFGDPGITFARVKIVGENQYGEMTTWEKRYSPTEPMIETTRYWWEGTIVLELDIPNVGTRHCVIDYLNTRSSQIHSYIIYRLGSGCSGETGSASSRAGQRFVEFLDGFAAAMALSDSHALFQQLVKADDAVGCISEIAEGFRSPLRIIRVTTKCGNVVLSEVNGIIGNYGKQVQMR